MSPDPRPAPLAVISRRELEDLERKARRWRRVAIALAIAFFALCLFLAFFHPDPRAYW